MHVGCEQPPALHSEPVVPNQVLETTKLNQSMTHKQLKDGYYPLPSPDTYKSRVQSCPRCPGQEEGPTESWGLAESLLWADFLMSSATLYGTEVAAGTQAQCPSSK